MRSAVKLAGLLGVLGSLVGVGTAAAQGSPPPTPTVTVGGVVYAQYLYQLKDTANHVNNFDVTRAYVNVIGKFPSGLGTRVTADVYRNTDGSLAYRLKYAYAAFTPEHSAITFKLGQIHTPWLDWEEALWDYRMQGQMALERGGYMSSAQTSAPASTATGRRISSTRSSAFTTARTTTGRRATSARTPWAGCRPG